MQRPSVHVPQLKRTNTALGRCRLFLLFFCLILPRAAWTDDAIHDWADSTLVANAIAELDATRLDERWYFTMHIEHDGQQQIVNNDPQAEPALRRNLLSINGSEPTEAERADFRAAEQARIEEEADNEQGFQALIDVSTLNLLEVSESWAEYAFIPRIRKLEKAQDALRGTLRLNRQSRVIETIRIFNVESFSPAISVSLENFLLRFDFAMQEGINLLTVTENQAQGKVAFVKSFDSSTRIAFSDYRAIEE